MHGDIALDGSTRVCFWFDVELLSERVRVVMAVGIWALVWSVRGEGNLVVIELHVYREEEKK
jgi:hypothetical protein